MREPANLLEAVLAREALKRLEQNPAQPAMPAQLRQDMQAAAAGTMAALQGLLDTAKEGGKHDDR